MRLVRLALIAVPAALSLAACGTAVSKTYVPVDSQLKPWQMPEEYGPKVEAMPTPSKTGEEKK
jgi:hypothetical protein